MKKIFISSDHAGFNLKEQIKKKFSKKYKFQDLGTNNSKVSVNYPYFAHRLCKKVGNNTQNNLEYLRVLLKTLFVRLYIHLDFDVNSI